MKCYAVVNMIVKEEYKACVCTGDEEYGVCNFIHSVVYKAGRKYTEMQELWATLPSFFSSDAWLFYFPSFFILRGWVGGRLVLSVGLKRLEWRAAV